MINRLNTQQKYTHTKHTFNRLGRSLLATALFSLTVANSDAHDAVIASTPLNQKLITTYLKTHPLEQRMNQKARLKTQNAVIKHFIKRAKHDLSKKRPLSTPKTMALRRYPVRSKHLSPGKPKVMKVDTALPTPIFLMGDDKHSRAWLEKNKTCLTQIRAKGFVVNVASTQAMQALHKNFPDLPLLALPGDALARWLHLSHYPTLIINQKEPPLCLS